MATRSRVNSGSAPGAAPDDACGREKALAAKLLDLVFGADVRVGGRGRAEQRDDSAEVAAVQEAAQDGGEDVHAKHVVQ